MGSVIEIRLEAALLSGRFFHALSEPRLLFRITAYVDIFLRYQFTVRAGAQDPPETLPEVDIDRPNLVGCMV